MAKAAWVLGAQAEFREKAWNSAVDRQRVLGAQAGETKKITVNLGCPALVG